MNSTWSTATNVKRALSLILLVPLLGAARGCGGDDPAILGEVDAGVDTGISEADMGVVETDLGVATDMGTPRTLVGHSIGNTDTDFSLVIRVGPDGDPRIIHDGEAGFVLYTRATAGVWLPDNITLDHEPHYGTGCDMFVAAAVDASNNTHVAYRYIPTPGGDGDCSGINDSEIRYMKIVGDTPSAPVTIETIAATPSGAFAAVSPGIAVDASGVAHIVYRAGTAGFADLRYASVSGGVATTPITIPDSTSNYTTDEKAITQGGLVPGVGPDGTLYVLAAGFSGGAIHVLRRTTAGWQTPFEIPTSEEIAAATVGLDGTVHVLTGTNYYTVSPTGTSTLVGPTPASEDCRAAAIAVNSLGEPSLALSCGSSDNAGAGYTTLHAGVWSTILQVGLTPGTYADPVTTPSIAYDAHDVPHIAYQGFGADDLYYATFE